MHNMTILQRHIEKSKTDVKNIERRYERLFKELEKKQIPELDRVNGTN